MGNCEPLVPRSVYIEGKLQHQSKIVRLKSIVTKAVVLAQHLLVLLLLKLLLHVLLLLLMHSSLKGIGQPQELGLHRHAVARALLCCRRHHHVEVVHQLRGVRVQGDVRSSTARGRHPLLRGPHLPDGATLELLCGEDVLGLGLELKGWVE